MKLRNFLNLSIRTSSSYKRFYSVRVRFAPSPTGHLHLGGFRTALLNFLFARKHGGHFLLRIEDTDKDRAIAGTASLIENDLQWLGLTPDESPLQGGPFGPYTQSERLDIYKRETERLIEEGHAYPCFCTEKRLELLKKDALRRREKPMYDNKCRDLDPDDVKKKIKGGQNYCVRFKLPSPPYTFQDIICGGVTLKELQGDFVILKSDNHPTYHLASVIDDHYMEISHVLRGIEWQVSTGKHLSLYKALGYTPPLFAHLPLILNKDGTKLSKRQGDITIDHYRQNNYYPESLTNFVMGNTNQIENLDILANKFELESTTSSNNKLDFAYLDILNQLILKKARDSPETMITNLFILKSIFPGEEEEYYQRLLIWCPERVARLPDLKEEFPFLSTNFEPDKCLEQNEIKIVDLLIQDIENNFQVAASSQGLKTIGKNNDIEFKTIMKIMRGVLCGVKNVHPSIPMKIRQNVQTRKGALILPSHPSPSLSNPAAAAAAANNIHVTEPEFRHKELSQYFCFEKEKEDRKVIMKCIVYIRNDKGICGRLLSVPKGIYSNLYKHLKNTHPTIPIQPSSYVQSRQGALILPSTPPPLCLPTLKIPAAVELSIPSVIEARQRCFDKSILDMYAVDGLPFDFVEKPGFLNLILQLDEQIKVKSKRSYTLALKKNIEFEKSNFRNELMKYENQDCHFLIDIWSFQTYNIFEIKCHYIDENWEKKQKTIKYDILNEGMTLKGKFEEVLLQYGFNLTKIGLVACDSATIRKANFNMNNVFDEYNELLETTTRIYNDYPRQIELNTTTTTTTTTTIEMEEEDNELLLEPDDLSDQDDDDDDDYNDNNVVVDESSSIYLRGNCFGEDYGFGQLSCVAHSLQLVINNSIKSDEKNKIFFKYINIIIKFFKKSKHWKNELNKLTNNSIIIEPSKSYWNLLMNFLKLFQMPTFSDAVQQILHLVRLEERNIKIRKQILFETQPEFINLRAQELFSILNPFQDAIEKLQSDSTTSNLVILAIVSAFRRLLSVEVDEFVDLKQLLLLTTRDKMLQVLNSDEYIVASILDPRQKLQLFTISWDYTMEILQIPTRLAALSKLTIYFESQRSAQLQIQRGDDTFYHPNIIGSSNKLLKINNIKRESNSMFDVLNDVVGNNSHHFDKKSSEIDIYLNEIICTEDIDPLEYWRINTKRFPILSLLAKRYLAIPATAGKIEKIITIQNAILKSRQGKLTIEQMEHVLLLREIREPELRHKIDEIDTHPVETIAAGKEKILKTNNSTKKRLKRLETSSRKGIN